MFTFAPSNGFMFIILYLLIIPLLVMLAAKRWPIIEKISPMVILYVIGLTIGNIGIVGENGLQICETVSNATVLLSIPLMLLGSDFRKWSATAALIVAISYALSHVIPIGNSTAVIILLLTTLSIALSFWRPLKKLGNTFDTGLYFVYVFCLAVASMVNVRDLEFTKYLFILYYIVFAVFGSLTLQILLAKLFKIDGDLTLAASISLINSPPFVPMVAAVLKNQSVILPGIAIGLLGYAVGNYLGIGIFMLLSSTL